MAGFFRGVAVMVVKYEVLVIALLLPAGCGFLSLGPAKLTSDDPAQKIPAIKWAARHDDRAAIPLLIKALSSQDSAIRFYAIYALRKITGHEFGYIYYASKASRRLSIARWKTWLAAKHSSDSHSAGTRPAKMKSTSEKAGGLS